MTVASLSQALPEPEFTHILSTFPHVPAPVKAAELTAFRGLVV